MLAMLDPIAAMSSAQMTSIPIAHSTANGTANNTTRKAV